ncbi:midas domain-containing protein [Helicobacter salomonis]|uniref:hypothetical protein n=1 Tax=Helicobacter salomonis TaxID=56878 RepID=UPI000CF01B86|nr:hypothetical protein [Helicobacter salomonis]
MKILLVNQNKMVEKLFENIAKKLALDLVVREHVGDALSKLQEDAECFFFADDTVVDEEGYQHLAPYLEGTKISAFVHRKSVAPFGSFTHYIQKPFLPTDVLHILEKTLEALHIPPEPAPLPLQEPSVLPETDMGLGDLSLDSSLNQLEELEGLLGASDGVAPTSAQDSQETSIVEEQQEEALDVPEVSDTSLQSTPPSPEDEPVLSPTEESTSPEPQTTESSAPQPTRGLMDLSFEDLLPVDNSNDEEEAHGESFHDTQIQEQTPSLEPDVPVEEPHAPHMDSPQMQEDSQPISDNKVPESPVGADSLEGSNPSSRDSAALSEDAQDLEPQEIEHIEDIPEPVMASVMDEPLETPQTDLHEHTPEDTGEQSATQAEISQESEEDSPLDVASPKDTEAIPAEQGAKLDNPTKEETQESELLSPAHAPLLDDVQEGDQTQDVASSVEASSGEPPSEEGLETESAAEDQIDRDIETTLFTPTPELATAPEEALEESEPEAEVLESAETLPVTQALDSTPQDSPDSTPLSPDRPEEEVLAPETTQEHVSEATPDSTPTASPATLTLDLQPFLPFLQTLFKDAPLDPKLLEDKVLHIQIADKT